MKIICEHLTITPNESGKERLAVHCDEVRHDLVLEQIIETKGVEFVLNAIGEDEILKHINKALAA